MEYQSGDKYFSFLGARENVYVYIFPLSSRGPITDMQYIKRALSHFPGGYGRLGEICTYKSYTPFFLISREASEKHPISVADLRGGGGLGGLNSPPPPLGLPSKNLMCIEKRHHYVQTHTVCSYSTLSQAQIQTIGFKPPPPPWAAK